MGNRPGLPGNSRLTAVTGTTKREEVVAIVRKIPGRHRLSVGGDQGQDIGYFVHSLRVLQAMPRVAQHCTYR